MMLRKAQEFKVPDMSNMQYISGTENNIVTSALRDDM